MTLIYCGNTFFKVEEIKKAVQTVAHRINKEVDSWLIYH